MRNLVLILLMIVLGTSCEIEKVSKKQWAVVFALLLFITLLYIFFQEIFILKPHRLFNM